jgi:hypothetical protein
VITQRNIGENGIKRPKVRRAAWRKLKHLIKKSESETEKIASKERKNVLLLYPGRFLFISSYAVDCFALVLSNEYLR